jgi:hypothetical protein
MAKKLSPEEIKKLKADKAAEVATEQVVVKDSISDIVANKAHLIALKKAVPKHCDPSLDALTEKESVIATKIVTSTASDDLEAGVIKRTVVGNTYGWFDSHKDVHIPGIFTKSISENKNIFHLHDHVYQLAAKVGTPTRVYEQSVSLESLGLNKTGFASCLLMDSDIKKDYNPMIYNEYLTKQVNQHSVGMIYQKLFLCIPNADYKEEFANWNTYKSYVINLADAEQNGYFWAVTEAKLVEISCVLKGSNELTPTINVKENEPPVGTQKHIEPVKSTHKINYEYLKTNLK